ncbi:small GTP-binding protein [Oceanithermus profundus DSM 14977]|uniref:Small GTP-binding protein n=1 Tax=Oceanithermus profundus (strain DSM 14977 / NBRC 100410 / VKM B-2274 / 506) TaxID=670487 RepID=E4U9D8_OCEP5|nr:dynamin family protein [Oceanithermus profundus]ADR36967.1 small GTP-binding protein [Oceanithermus profundus DSM 14977]
MIDPELQRLAGEVRGLLAEGLEALAQAGETTTPLRQALQDLEGPFLLVVAGEFNSGKSSLLNALLGRELLREGVTPTTDRIQWIAYGEEPGSRALEPGLVVLRLPHPLLKDVHLVDTPGTNAVIEHHQILTERFLPRADLILFTTSADRPYTASERDFLELIRGWGKKVVLVVNKLDLLGPDEAEEVLAYVREQAARTLGVEPPVFGVSARRARAGEDGGVKELEAFIERVLREEAARIKLGSPLGVLERLLEQGEGRLGPEAQALESELETCARLEALLERHEGRVREEFRGQTAQLREVVARVRRRAARWLDETLRFGRLFDLMNASKIQKSFEAEVVGEAHRELERKIQESLAWLARAERDLLASALDLLNTRGGARAYEGDGPTLSEQVTRALEAYDPEAEARDLQGLLSRALQHTALAELGAVGLGAGLALALHGLAADVTGVTAGLVAAVLGLSILPRRKRTAQRRIDEGLDRLERELTEGLEATLEGELARSAERFRALYRDRCAELEDRRQKLQALRERLQELRRRAGALRIELEA